MPERAGDERAVARAPHARIEVALDTLRRIDAHARFPYYLVLLADAHLAAGRQAYVVYPLVEESSKVDVRAATEMADHLAAEVFPEYRVELLHV